MGRIGRGEGRGGAGWNAPRYAVPPGFHPWALALALAGPLLGLLALALRH